MNKEQKERVIQELKGMLNESSILFSKEVSQKKFGCKLYKLREKAEENGISISKNPKGYLVMPLDKITIAE